MDDEQARILRRKQRFNNESQEKQQYGLVSKGEMRLKTDLNAQKEFFKQIKVNFASIYKQKIDLKEEDFDLLIDNEPLNQSTNDKHKPDILMDLRKLREALISSNDSEFVCQVFLFSCRVGILLDNYQTYVPSMAFLWNDQRLSKHLNSNQQWEIVYLQTIYEIIAKNNWTESLRRFQSIESRFGVVQVNQLWTLINGLATKTYTTLQYTIQTETNPYITCLLKQLIGFRLIEKITFQLEKSYFGLPESSLQGMTGLNLTQVKHYKPQWTFSNHYITIRHRNR